MAGETAPMTSRDPASHPGSRLNQVREMTKHRIRTDWRSYRTGGRDHEHAYYTCEECGRTVVLMFIDPHGAAKSYYRHLPEGTIR